MVFWAAFLGRVTFRNIRDMSPWWRENSGQLAIKLAILCYGLAWKGCQLQIKPNCFVWTT